MKKVTDSLKKVFGRFDDSLFNPPKENLTNKNFKGQTILRRKLSDGGPKPTPEQVLSRAKIYE